LGSLVSYQERFDVVCKDRVKSTTAILLKVVDINISNEVFGGLGRAINALAWINQNQGEGTELSTTAEIVSSSIAAVSELMDLYVLAVSSTLILQEPSPDFVSETVSSRVRMFGVFDDLVIAQSRKDSSDFLQMVQISTGYYSDSNRNISIGRRKLDGTDALDDDLPLSIGMGLVSFNRKLYGDVDVLGNGYLLFITEIRAVSAAEGH
jgi:hypothetical protein